MAMEWVRSGQTMKMEVTRCADGLDVGMGGRGGSEVLT